ncbi:MAG: DUF1963 domain-containing protein [Oscillospiraceae bacterium]|nr:DUF1963 domain-containing protein [Oscillospiraceae bacterium]
MRNKAELRGKVIPVGASKVGGFPDLPPEIEYPEMSGFTRTRLKGQRKDEVELVPESSMQLMAQINLYELAQTGADLENFLPKRGMLYFFCNGCYGCDVFDVNSYPGPNDKIYVDTPEKAQIAKVIYWDGDITTLCRKEPKLSYLDGIMKCLKKEYALDFCSDDNYDEEMLENLDEILDILEIEENDLCYTHDKLFGVPWTVNPRDMGGDDVNLLQMRDGEGSVVSDFWAINKKDLADWDFSAARFWEDVD